MYNTRYIMDSVEQVASDIYFLNTGIKVKDYRTDQGCIAERRYILVLSNYQRIRLPLNDGGNFFDDNSSSLIYAKVIRDFKSKMETSSVIFSQYNFACALIL